MGIKFDHQRTKHQLLHLSISLATIIICITYIQYRPNWAQLTSFWNSLVPIVLTGEILKVSLARHFDRIEESFARKQRKKIGIVPRDLLAGMLVQVLCGLLYGFLCVVLGAPVFQNYEQTFVLSSLLTLITVSPTVFLLGAGGALQVCFCEKPDFVSKSEDIALSLFKFNAIGGVLGAWAGSIVMPLDWDREWQVYPIPNVVGALLGSTMGNIYECSCILYHAAKVFINKKRS